ncbi:MAG: AI-2E family transporter [Hydrogenophilus sp.]|nr:AI-2E family transporter [Hydrogenophilus sp.]
MPRVAWSAGEKAAVVVAVVAVGAVLQAASGWVAPLLVAFFLALVSTPPLMALRRLGVPWGVGVVLLFTGVGWAVFQLFSVLEWTARAVAANAPVYQERWSVFVTALQEWLRGLGVEWEGVVSDFSSLPLGMVAEGARLIARSAGELLARFALVLLAYVFLLLEIPTLPERLAWAFPDRRTAVQARRLARAVFRYLAIKTTVSAMTGAAVWGLLVWRGVDFALFFALLAALLNFVPTVGSVVAAVPAVLIALLMQGLEEAIIVTAGYLGINVVLGNVLEPRWMGQVLGLSPTVVLVSLFLWGWLLGVVGAFLSIPLTMIARLALERLPGGRGWAALLSDRPPRSFRGTLRSLNRGRREGASEEKSEGEKRTGA